MRKLLLLLALVFLCSKAFADDVNGLFSINNSNIGGICIYLGGSDYTGNASSAFTVSASTTTQGNAGANTQLYFSTFTLNANTLINTNEYLVLEAAGTFAPNADAKLIQLEANTSTALNQSVTNTNFGTAANNGWRLQSTINRNALNKQAWSTPVFIGTSTLMGAGTSTLTEGSNITFAITGQEATSNVVGDISFLYYKAWLCPNVQ